MIKPAHFSVLGGGPSGLSVGYYAKKNGLLFTIYEASNQIGGNSSTLKHGDFLFDSGAHRFHDRDDEMTEEIKNLLGNDLNRVNIPSQIYTKGKYIDFPLSPFNLLKNIGLSIIVKAGFEIMNSRLRGKPNGNFESFALYMYGKTLANLFLLNYTKKLWGVPCSRLSEKVTGKRLNGINLRSFLEETFLGRKTTQHLEGSFLYPTMGIGTISKRMGEFCGKDNISLNSKITKIIHNHRQIKAIEINGKKRINIEQVVSTLPLDYFIQIMEPAPPTEILLLSKSLHFSNVILVAFFLNKNSITNSGTIYFPDVDIPFTRIYEPKNRNIYMSPPGKTSLVAEIPCQQEDKFWNLEDEKLIALIRSYLMQFKWIKEKDIIDASVRKMNYGYPILEVGHEEKVEKINTFLNGFSNLKLSGRNGKFEYSWIHNMLRLGKEIIEEYKSNFMKKKNIKVLNIGHKSTNISHNDYDKLKKFG